MIGVTIKVLYIPIIQALAPYYTQVADGYELVSNRSLYGKYILYLTTKNVNIKNYVLKNLKNVLTFI